MRNPLFAGLTVSVAGMALALPSLVVLAAAATLGAVLHVWVVRVEEPRLRTRFGAAYDAYLRAVPRWLPRRRRDDP